MTNRYAVIAETGDGQEHALRVEADSNAQAQELAWARVKAEHPESEPEITACVKLGR